MSELKLRTIEQLRAFLAGTQEVQFEAVKLGDDERYAHVDRVLGRFKYERCSKADRGVVLAYLRSTSGYSRAQVTRLVERWLRTKKSGQSTPLQKHYCRPAHAFARVYTPADISLLAEVDRCHEDVSGPANCHVLQRAYEVYGDPRFERLSKVSASHVYNLRNRATYQAQRSSFTKTRAVCNPIGVRKAPRADGQAGYIRIDTVHQGDLDKQKGVYTINAVDIVSQWEVLACVEGISEVFLLPVLEHMLAQFPFEVKGFHSDNGGEYINGRVAKMLEKLRIEQTKSRSRQSSDNAQVESKNASVVRKQMGYSHIAQKHAKIINVFYTEYMNPWVNLHRPSMYASELVNDKGKVVKKYKPKDVRTPAEKLLELAAQDRVTFKPGITPQSIKDQAMEQTDLEASASMIKAKMALFETFNSKRARA